jgi:hypothetical protein
MTAKDEAGNDQNFEGVDLAVLLLRAGTPLKADLRALMSRNICTPKERMDSPPCFRFQNSTVKRFSSPIGAMAFR